jgi:hypothetical protein
MKKLAFLLISVVLAIKTADCQNFHNLKFTDKCDTSKTGLCYWDLSWGGKGAVSPARNGNINTMLIQGTAENSVGFSEQAAVFPAPKGDEFIRLTADIKTANVVGKGVGLNLWFLDDKGNTLATKDMGGFYSLNWIRGTTQWKTCSISIVLPKETAKVKIGAILFGKGRAWFSNYRFSVTAITNRRASPLAVKYINAACDIIKKHSLVKDSVNISQLKQIALKIAGPAKTYNDCFLAVNYLIESLRLYGDEHSFFMSAAEKKNWEVNGSAIHKIENAKCEVMGDYGYIKVPGFHGGNQKRILAFANALQSDIKKLADAGVKGWIVDLRENSGGNQEPMIAGLGPLFSSAKLGSLLDVDNQYSSWNYKNGRYFFDDSRGWKVTHPVKLKSQLPIAVLTSAQTGSSGEIATISFIGNAHTKSFGQPTWGLTTGNGSFDLPDGSQMFIASTHMVDRNGKIYTGPVIPDVVVKTSPDDKNNVVLDNAMEWLKTQR